jgi:hypothetical protein
MSVTLDADAIHDLTRYRRASDQLRELHRQGFYRARVGRDGAVILEREHYAAVCAGRNEPARPKVKPPVLRTA